MGAGASVGAFSIDMNAEDVESFVVSKFKELDASDTDFVLNPDVINVVDWVLNYFSDKLSPESAIDLRLITISKILMKNAQKLTLDEFRQIVNFLLIQIRTVAVARSKFKEFDANNSGSIETGKIRQAIESTLAAYPAEENTESYTKRIMSSIDINNDGHLNLAEFTKIIGQMISHLDLIQRAQIKFKELDADSSGYLENSEIDALLDIVLLNYATKNQQQRLVFKKDLLRRMDVDGDGRLSLVEFTEMFAEMMERVDLIERARCKFMELDRNKNGFLDRVEIVSVVRIWIRNFVEYQEFEYADSIVDIFMERIDVDGDNQVSLLEFLEVFEDAVQVCAPPAAKAAKPTASYLALPIKDGDLVLTSGKTEVVSPVTVTEPIVIPDAVTVE